MAFTLAEAIIKLSAPQEGLAQDLKKAEDVGERSARTIAERFQKLLNARTLFKGLVGGGAGLILGRFLQGAVDQFLSIEQAQRRFQAQTGASRREADVAGQAIRQAFVTSRFGIEELTSATVGLRREMGLTAQQAAGALPIFVTFAKVTGQDVGQVVRDVDDVMDAWGLTIEHVPALLDRLKRTSELTGASVQQMQAVLAIGSGQFQALGLSLDEAIALMGKLAQNGVPATSALRALSVAAAKVESPEQFNQLLKKLGAIKDPATRAATAIDLFGARAGPAMARLLDESGLALDDLVQKIRNSGGAVQDAAKDADSFNDRLEQMKRRVLDVGAAVAGPVLNSLGNFAIILLSLKTLFPTLGASLGGFIGVAGRGLIAAVVLAAKAIAGFIAALNPITLIIAAIVAVIGLFAAAWTRNWFHIADVVREKAPFIAGIIDGIVEKVARAIDFLSRLVRRARGAAAEVETGGLAAQRAEERAGFQAVPSEQVFGRAPRGGKKVDLGLGGKQATNEALANALRLHEALVALDRLTLQQQIANLEKIKAAHAKSAEERLDIDVRIHRTRTQLIEEEARKNIQAVEQSLEFIQSRLIAADAPLEEIVAGFRRVIARIQAARNEDFVDAKGKAEALQRVQKALADFQFASQREAAERIKAIRQGLTVEIERLTLDEFEFERREIHRRFAEMEQDVRRRLALNQGAAEELKRIEQAKALALAAAAGREAASAADQEVRLTEIRRALGKATIEDLIAAEERLKATLDPKDRVAIAQAEQRIADLRLQQKQITVDLADAERARLEELRDERAEAGRALAEAISAQIQARQALLAEITDQREKVRVLAEIRGLQRELVILANAFDPFRGLRLAAEDALRIAFSWHQAWTDAISGVTSQIEGFFSAVRRGEKDALTALRDVALGVVDEILRVVERAIAQQLVQRILQNLQARLPALQIPGLAAGGGPDMAAATVAAGTQVAGAITGSGVTASTAITTSGTGVAQAIIAAGQAAAAAIGAAAGLGAGAGGGLFNLFTLRGGGVLKRLRVAAAQFGLMTHRPLLAALAEAGGTELALPLPRGLRPEDLARFVQAGAAVERGGVQEGDVHVNFNAPLSVASARDVHRVARAVGDAVRWARRGFHPVMREGR